MQHLDHCFYKTTYKFRTNTVLVGVPNPSSDHYNLGEPCILNAPLPQERSWDDHSKFGNFV